MIIAWHRSNETSKRLDETPGVGPARATALVASIADPKAFRSGRDFSAWIGLVDGEAVWCDDAGVAIFEWLRRRDAVQLGNQ